jgi:basic amino acid/polyamine antiporter, APA family
VGSIVAFTALNYFGVRRSSRANLLIVAVSLGALLTFVVAGIPAFDAANLRPFAPAGVRGAMEAAAILFFAYTGYARIATLAEEVRDPERTIPRAIVITLAGAVALYSAVAIVAVGAIGAEAMAGSAAPLHAAATAIGAGPVGTVVAVGGVTAMLGVILSQLLGLSRMAFAMARRGDLPRALARVHATHEVPGRAVLAIGAVAAVVAATGSLRDVASTASFAILVYYGIANVCAMRMPRERRLFHPLIPWIGVIGCALLALSLSPTIIALGLAVLAVGCAGRAVLAGRGEGGRPGSGPIGECR